MPRQTTSLGAGQRSARDFHQWDPAPALRPRVDAALVDAAAPRYVARLRLAYAATARNQLLIVSDRNEGAFRAGDDLSAAWEASAAALTVHAGALSLTVPGPGPADASEPYLWAPSAEGLARQRTFLDAYWLLPAPARRTTRLTLDDGRGSGRVDLRVPRPVLRAGAPPPAPAAAGARWRAAARALAPSRGLLAAVEVRHDAAAGPLLFVNAGRARELGGREYLGLPFTWRLAPAEPDRAPTTRIAVPWAGEEMAAAIEDAKGLTGATVILSEWSVDPLSRHGGALEWSMTMYATRARAAEDANGAPVAGAVPRFLIVDLGMTPHADRPAVTARYTPETDPWTFA